MRRRREYTAFYLMLVCGTVAIVAGGLTVALAIAPDSLGFHLDGRTKSFGKTLIQIGILLELAAIVVHERMNNRRLRRFSRPSTLQSPMQQGEAH